MDLEEFKLAIYGSEHPNFCYSKMAGSVLPWAKVRVPHLKEVVKNVVKDTSFSSESIPLDESVDLQMAYFMLSLSRIKGYTLQLDFLLAHSEKALSWMSTDTCLQYLKGASLELYEPYCLQFLKKKDVFSRRFGYVLALGFYKEKDISFLFKHFLKDDRYYVMMSEAWLLANLAITHFEEVYAFLQTSKLTLLCKRKAISKMCDSFRISAENKERLKALRNSIVSEEC